MKKIFVLIVFIFCIMFVNGQDGRARLWNRVPKFHVYDAIESFLNHHNIYDCFYFVEKPTQLRFKCFHDNKLSDVSLELNPIKKDNFIFTMVRSGMNWI